MSKSSTQEFLKYFPFSMVTMARAFCKRLHENPSSIKPSFSCKNDFAGTQRSHKKKDRKNWYSKGPKMQLAFLNIIKVCLDFFSSFIHTPFFPGLIFWTRSRGQKGALNRDRGSIRWSTANDPRREGNICMILGTPKISPHFHTNGDSHLRWFFFQWTAIDCARRCILLGLTKKLHDFGQQSMEWWRKEKLQEITPPKCKCFKCNGNVS